LNPAASSDELPVGRVGRPHGLDGSFHVTRPLERALTLGAVIRVGAEERTIERRAGTERSPILRVSGVADRDAVAALRGAQLALARSHLPSLPEGEWWAHELEGLRVGDGERELGRVTEMIELPTCEALRVRTDEGGELIVPLVAAAIRTVDVPGGRVEVDAGFLRED
jgi:16S rRNA processing protein RimM